MIINGGNTSQSQYSVSIFFVIKPHMYMWGALKDLCAFCEAFGSVSSTGSAMAVNFMCAALVKEPGGSFRVTLRPMVLLG